MANAAEPATPAGRSTKEALILTGERLFALHGIDGVSLRRIGTEAGMGMNTVVQYHFGSKDRLVEAIVQSRVELLNSRRALLDERAPADDLRAVVEAHLLPVIELGEEPDCYYLMFLEQLQRYGVGEHPFDRLPAATKSTQRRYVRRVGRLLTHVPTQLRELRINRASAMCLHVCADRQRARSFGAVIEPYALHVSQLLDGVEAFLATPPSAETLRAMRTSSKRPTALVALP
ncbi:MAG: transcriptional regulator [Actinomycetia bacterium]|nr:transcriptional regulator [Actinomycetes bacterium]